MWFNFYMNTARAAIIVQFPTPADLATEVDRQVTEYETHEASAFENIADQFGFHADDVEDAYYAAKLSDDLTW